MEVKITEKQKKALAAIYNAIEEEGIPPTLAELRDALNVSSNQAVINILDILERKGYIKRGTGQARGILILPLGCKILGKEEKIPDAGISSAGPFLESLDTIASWVPLRGAVIENEIIKQSKENYFAIKVQGDSMINAGINDGDILLVKKTSEFKSNDIVVARCDDGTTVKRFIAESDGRAYLKPENPAYNNIPIYEEMVFEGKVILNLSEVDKKL